jgi:hypothetical protein
MLEQDALDVSGYSQRGLEIYHDGLLSKRIVMFQTETMDEITISLDNILVETDAYLKQINYKHPAQQQYFYALASPPRSMLLNHATAYGFKTLVTRLLDLSRDHYGDVYKMKEHQRYVNTAVTFVRSLPMLRYLVEEEHADVNYIERFSGRHVLASIHRYLKETEVISVMQYLYEQAGFNQTEMHFDHGCRYSNKGLSVLKFAAHHATTFLFLDALLHYGYGYSMSFTTSTCVNGSINVQSTPCSNIDEFRLEGGTMNPLIYAITNHYSDYYNELWINYLITHHKANINAQDGKGNTAVIYAIKNRSFELVASLVNKYEVNIYLQNNAGESVHSLAECRNYFKERLVRIIEGKKFSPN